jgi:hypothetical protein
MRIKLIKSTKSVVFVKTIYALYVLKFLFSYAWINLVKVKYVGQ